MAVTSEPARSGQGCLKALLVGLGLLFLVGLYYLSPLSASVNLLTLDLPKLDRQIDSHMRSVHRETSYACLYVVVCDSDGAHLELRTQLTPAEIIRIRNDVWRRRLESYCVGRVANIALEHSSDGKELPPQDKYSFSGGGFGGAVGFGAGGSFDASGKAPPCTRDKAYWTREQGIVHGR